MASRARLKTSPGLHPSIGIHYDVFPVATLRIESRLSLFHPKNSRILPRLTHPMRLDQDRPRGHFVTRMQASKRG